MSLTPVALVLLNVQRHHLEAHPHERTLARAWAAQVDQARSAGQLVVLLQWDGPSEPVADDPAADHSHDTFSRGWTLYSDFRAEAGDLLVRARVPDPFVGSELEAELHGRAVRELHLLALPDAPELAATAAAAQARGFAVVWPDTVPTAESAHLQEVAQD
jgi:nicotinamidase-related amidase